MESSLSEVLQQEASVRRIIPEKEIVFDSNGRGRVHDLAIDCVVDGEKSLFVGLEAKVDESFGLLVHSQLRVANRELVRNCRSKALQRIKQLPARYSPSLSVDAVLDIRYQLVHGTAGTVSARQETGELYDLYVFYVLVFKTFLYDQQAGEENYQDFLRFIHRVGGSPIPQTDAEAYSLTMDDRQLTCIYEQMDFPCDV